LFDVAEIGEEPQVLLLQHLDFIIAVPPFRSPPRHFSPVRFEAADEPHPPSASNLTPPRRGLRIPRQDLLREPGRSLPPLDTRETDARRLVVIAAAVAIGLLVSKALLEVLGWAGLTWSSALVVALSGLLSAWTGFGCISAVAGACAVLSDRRRASHAAGPPDPDNRTAILVPVYNEDPGRVLAGVEAIAQDLRRLGLERLYDLFVLSDTRDAAAGEAEIAAVLRLKGRLAEGPEVYYRRRARNIDRKAGNIADWVANHGARYEHMLVLDADSLMSGETIAALTAAMEADPRLGLLQTTPTIVNATTPFARLQQFASHLYGPVFTRGQAWWSGSEGNYWGHNAIIRVRAFAESAGLPHLRAPAPFGGHIMSHDFVEAALLRRRGWAVRTIAGLPGSYEEAPPTLLDAAARDRRWCQGNLQHLCLLGAAGLHWVSRLHLLFGAFAYLAPVLWLMLLICGAGVWPEALAGVDAPRVIGLFVLTLSLLIAPRLMALGLALSSPEQRRGFGGAWPLIGGFLVESLASMLIAPVMMVMQSAAVAEVLIGRDSGWSAQRREGVALSCRDAWRAHAPHVALGVLGGVLAFLTSPPFLLWTSPVFLSLALSALLSLHTSRPLRQGRWRLFQAPVDNQPPAVLSSSRALRRGQAAETGPRRGTEPLFGDFGPMYGSDLQLAG
jgi:membrane glycosyltransferase